jgi:hypothetical protein
MHTLPSEPCLLQSTLCVRPLSFLHASCYRSACARPLAICTSKWQWRS